jgi:GNAT superfamily N-acetyltransferase
MHPADAAEALRLFDNEFIFSRARTIGFSLRFGDLFSTPDPFIAAGSIASDVVSALLVRPFHWSDDTREWRGAMIGLVCTRPDCRGRGYAAGVLAAAEARCRMLDLDFGVLWAARGELYERQGWIRSDRGMLGVRRARDAPEAPPTSREIGDELLERAHALHQKRSGPRVTRALSNYRRLLPPAEQTLVFVEGDALALCGSCGRTGYVFDVVGTEREMPQLWERLSARFGDLYVNVEHGSCAHLWLEAHARLDWARQSLAMWKPLRAETVPFHMWHVPFLDRI